MTWPWHALLTFEMNATINHVNKSLSAFWLNGLAGKLLENLRKWTHSSGLTSLLELQAELSKVRKKRKEDPEVLSSVPSAIRNKYKCAGVSVDEIKLVAALIAEDPKDYLSSMNT